MSDIIADLLLLRAFYFLSLYFVPFCVHLFEFFSTHDVEFSYSGNFYHWELLRSPAKEPGKLRIRSDSVYTRIETVFCRISPRDIRQVAGKSPRTGVGARYFSLYVDEGNCTRGRTSSPVVECYFLSSTRLLLPLLLPSSLRSPSIPFRASSSHLVSCHDTG